VENALIECVPNFSEGRNPHLIHQIAETLAAVPGVRLLEVDPGPDANRTVMTLAGPPDAVCEAAFRGIERAAALIDMRQHQGAHPRLGATDVCPLIPLQGIDMAQTAALARQLAQRVGEELGIPTYCYEYAALAPERRNLATIRAGEYEGLPEKLKHFPPDFGPAMFHARAGASVIGARHFLVAWNCNLATMDVKVAKAIAAEVRESGFRTVGTDGTVRHVPGRLPAVKAIGWLMPTYQCAQVSTNLTHLDTTPLHLAYETISEVALRHGTRVTGSELIGLVPRSAMLAAGRHFRAKAGSATEATEPELMAAAVAGLGLAALRPFDPGQKVIEYALAQVKSS
jgi:glutamate formiminotransferase / formiminotetrahydrofolate cyclodeaminase